MAELTIAVCKWLKGLEGMPEFGASGGLRVAKTMNNDLARSLIKEICTMGVRGFYELSESCETYGQLQRQLSRSWLTRDASKKNPKKVAAQRAREANAKWSDMPTDAGCASAEGGLAAAQAPACSTPDQSSTASSLASNPSSADGSSQGFSDSSASSLSAASSSLKRSVVFVMAGSSVTTHNLVLAPGLNGKTGIVREAQRCGRFAVEFSEPKCTVSLRAVNIALAQ